MKDETKWEDISFLIASKYRTNVLKELIEPKTPSKLSQNLKINKAHISRALSELENRKIIECLTPEAKKGKIYRITKYGEKILDKAKKI